MPKIIVTGGAGFIGSAVIWGLNQRGIEDILIVDTVTHDEQEHNLAPLRYDQHIEGDEFRQRLQQGEYSKEKVEAIIHLGAITSTTEEDWPKLQDTNVEFSQEIIRWCVDKNVRCIYASSGQTYGAGEQGFSDDPELFDKLKPITLYGKSKLLVDIWARDAGYLEQVVGLRYFNVFGPNEWHKEDMRSVIAKKFEEVKSGQPMKLFKSHNPDYADGQQQRDFIYIKDAVAATLFFLDNDAAGVFNVGTGQPGAWNDVAAAMFAALGQEPNVEYIDMPAKLKDRYQYFTQADISRLLEAGFRQEMTSLEDAVADYVQNYLVPHHHLDKA